MKYSIEFNGKDYNISDYTVAVALELDKAVKVSNMEGTISDKLRCLYNTITNIMGKEACEELVGPFNSADPNVINILFLKMIHEYEKPFREYKNSENDSVLNDKDVNKLIEILNSLSNLDKLKGVK